MIWYSIARIIVLIGALNWGLVGITNLFWQHFNLVDYIAYDILIMPTIAYIIYTIVGIAAIAMVIGMLGQNDG